VDIVVGANYFVKRKGAEIANGVLLVNVVVVGCATGVKIVGGALFLSQSVIIVTKIVHFSIVIFKGELVLAQTLFW
jgi:hypothetical protein